MWWKEDLRWFPKKRSFQLHSSQNNSWLVGATRTHPKDGDTVQTQTPLMYRRTRERWWPFPNHSKSGHPITAQVATMDGFPSVASYYLLGWRLHYSVSVKHRGKGTPSSRNCHVLPGPTRKMALCLHQDWISIHDWSFGEFVLIDVSLLQRLAMNSYACTVCGNGQRLPWLQSLERSRFVAGMGSNLIGGYFFFLYSMLILLMTLSYIHKLLSGIRKTCPTEWRPLFSTFFVTMATWHPTKRKIFMKYCNAINDINKKLGLSDLRHNPLTVFVANVVSLWSLLLHFVCYRFL